MNVLCTFNLVCVSYEKGLPLGLTLKDQRDFHEFYLTHSAQCSHYVDTNPLIYSKSQSASSDMMTTLG